MSFHRILTALAVTLLAASLLPAAPLRNVPQILVQPNGDTVHCFASGDEYYHWLHDADGFTIVEHPATGYFVYATIRDGALVPTAAIAGTTDPRAAGLQPGLNVIPDRATTLRKDRNAVIAGITSPKQGTLNNLIIFVRFSGENEFTDSVALYNRQLNDSSAGANSMINYFRENSYNKLTVRGTMYPAAAGAIVSSFQDSHTRGYFRPYNATTNPGGYTSDNDARLREHALLRDAVNAVSSQVPAGLTIDADGDGNVDNVCFIISGSPDGWGDLLWPHMWSLYTYNVSINGKRVYGYNLQLRSGLIPSGVGVLCHELSHTIGFPDLYRYVDQTIDPVSSWDLMCADLNPPQHTVAYQKLRYAGWIDSIPLISQTGTYSLKPLRSSVNNCYRIASPYSANEYFVVEYRKKEGTFESSLPGSGLLVYRINLAANGQGNANGPPDEVYIYRPGGTLSANGIPSRAYFNEYVTRTRINDATNPSSFLSSGDPGGLDIRNVGIPDSTISFKVTMLEPLCDLSGTSLPFGAVGLGYSRTDSVVMTNSGRETLFVSSVLSTDPNFSVNTATAVLAPAESRTIIVTYTPTGIGTHNGYLVLNHNATSSQDTISLSGSAVVPEPAALFSATSRNFGNVLVDSTRTDSVTVTNTGTGVMLVTSVTCTDAAFTASPDTFSLAPAAHRTLYMTFHPPAASAYAASIVVAYNAVTSPDSIAVTGNGVLPAPIFSVSPAVLDLGTVHVDSVKRDTFVVTNSGNASLTITSLVSTHGDFSVSPAADTIPAGSDGACVVTFAPTAGGPVNGAIVVTHDAPGSPDTILVSGIGAQPLFSPAAQSIAFDEVAVGSTKLKTFSVSNPGYAPLVVSLVSTDNDRFTVTPASVTIAALGGRIFQVRFLPDSDKTETANLTFVHDGASSPDTVLLTGTGTVPHAGFLPSVLTLDIGNADIDIPAKDTITITNNGVLSLSIDSVRSDAGVFAVSPASASVAPAASAIFEVTFAAPAMGPYAANLFFFHNAPGGADTIPLAGTGVRRIAMNTRWNMVSVPVGLPSYQGSAVFPTATSAVFGWTTGGYAAQESLSAGRGYWLKFGSDENVDMVGTPLLSDSLEVIAGWNMLGSITSPIPVAALATTGTSIVSELFGYSNGYTVADTIRPGRAYWVRVDQPGTIHIGPPGPVPGTPAGSRIDRSGYSCLTVRDAAGNAQSLYIDQTACPDIPVLLPPPPPVGGFDVCFAGRIMLESLAPASRREPVVTVAGAEYPITLSWNPADGITDIVVGDASGNSELTSVVLHAGETVTIADQAITQLKIGRATSTALPTTYALGQNYPNPFNPTTVITFQIPADNDVSLKVFDILGREIATLVNERLRAGSHEVSWNASSAPTGAYRYVLRAGETLLSKTMVLVK